MKRLSYQISRSLALLFLLSTCSGATSVTPVRASNSNEADYIVKGAAIYTMNAARTFAQALAVKDGRFICVGTERECQKFVGQNTKIQDWHGETMILPGFHDSHVHPIESAIELTRCKLDDQETKSQILAKISEYAKAHPHDEWILGSGWSLPVFPNASPDKSDLDSVVSDRPAFFLSQDAHSAWLNSKALALAKIDASTRNPISGRIERAADGSPSGTLRESAVDLVTAVMPKDTEAELSEGLRTALRLANSFGITSLQDAHARDAYLPVYARFAKEKLLTARVVAALEVNPNLDEHQVEHLSELRQKYSNDLFRPIAAKLFADGVIEAHTAALKKNYEDRSETSGSLNYDQSLMNRIVAALDKADFNVHIHAIGDSAVNEALNAFEFARKENGESTNRHQIAHLELMLASDINRFRDLHVVANFEPYWCFRDPYIEKCTEPLLGPERSQRLYQIHSVLKSGAIIASGSDWSVSSLNPLDAIQVAVTRCALTDKNGPAWIPQERVDLIDALAFYTINGAYVNKQDDVTGSLEVGKKADFIVLDKNLFKIEPSEIHNAHVIETYIDGNRVYARPDAH